MTTRYPLPLLLALLALEPAACVRTLSSVASDAAVQDGESTPKNDVGPADQNGAVEAGLYDARLADNAQGPDLPLPDLQPTDLQPTDLPLSDQAPAKDTSTTVLQLTPLADATVKDGSPSSNAGSSPQLWLGFCSNPSNHNMRAWLKFDLSLIPAEAVIVSAKLNLFFFVHWGTQDYHLHFSSDDSWSESGITWNNQPLAAPDPSSICPGFTVSNVWRSFDITALAKLEHAGDQILSVVIQGQTLYDPQTSPGDQENYAYAREAADPNLRPHLELTLSY